VAVLASGVVLALHIRRDMSGGSGRVILLVGWLSALERHISVDECVKLFLFLDVVPGITGVDLLPRPWRLRIFPGRLLVAIILDIHLHCMDLLIHLLQSNLGLRLSLGVILYNLEVLFWGVLKLVLNVLSIGL
jgi:hypothetical protein